IDSRLTSAAIRYFGSWRAAVEAAGIDYESVALVGRRRRSEKITKWTQESILEEICRLYRAGEDLTSTNVRRKHLSLYATARRKDHFGSWANALAEAGIDYATLKQQAKARRREEEDWKEQLLSDYEEGHEGDRLRKAAVRVDTGEPTARGNWARELIRERLAEMVESYGGLDSPPPSGQEHSRSIIHRLQSLLRRGRRKNGGAGEEE
ncbi:MAG: hypothetical protein KY468_04430, partial [Armatimonadetes bacterium]|nr:hypothetical protein [Armatimonadota bacterium]